MSPSPLHYQVIPIDPHAHLFRVVLTIPEPLPQQQIRMAAWIPGSYMIRDFARHIVMLRASDIQGESVVLQQIDKQRWQLNSIATPLIITAEIYAWDLSVRGAHFDQNHAYFNGTSLFFEVIGQSDRRCEVTLEPPPFAHHWRVATTLPRLTAAAWGFGRYYANGYQQLIDHPVEMADFTLLEFIAAGVTHAVTLSGRHFADTGRLKQDLARLCSAHIELFGRPAPFDRYLFQIFVVDEGYGGLEHQNSTSLIISRHDLPRVGEDRMSDGYRTLLGLCSHEYFHSWNVKRIRPRCLAEADLSQESPTPLLWFFEGVTSYYDDLMLLRCGLIDENSYLELLGETITRLLRTPGRHQQTLRDASFNAWTKFYRQDENSPNAIVSYYTKGAVVALAIDLSLQRHGSSLDQVMQHLWQRYLATGEAIDEATLEAVICQFGGADLPPLLHLAIRTTEELPIRQLLAQRGITLHLRPMSGSKDRGGKATNTAAPAVWLGIKCSADPLGVKVNHVLRDSPAMQAGISAGDILIAWDNLRIDLAGFERLTSCYKPNQGVTLHGFRLDELLCYRVTLVAPPLDTAWLERQP
jgi:predicted metalloprotease with PDZ domain